MRFTPQLLSFSLPKYKTQMQSHLSKFKSDLQNLSVGRASPSLLDSIKIDHASKTVSLKTVAQVSVKDSQSLCVTVFDEGLVAAVEKGIRAQGFNPQSTGNAKSVLFIPIPNLTKDGRFELLSLFCRDKIVKDAQGIAERTRTKIRSVRADARKDIKGCKLPKDEVRECEKEVQDVTDELVKEVGVLMSQKEKELTRT